MPSYERGPHGPQSGTYKTKSDVKKRESKRNRHVEPELSPIPQLSLDRVTGKVTDETSGKTYYLQPTN